MEADLASAKDHTTRPAHPAVAAGHGEATGTRRDFLMVAAGSWAAVGAAATLWPLVQQMNPDASTQALASIEVDLTPIKLGQAITVMWRGKPVFIRHRTKDEIAKAQFETGADGRLVMDAAGKPVKLNLAKLPDGAARNEGLPERSPAVDENRTKKDKENWLVLVGICTHLGCIPKGQALADVNAKGDWGGWFCPCHGSHYDTSGRIRKGPAPRNLDVPSYEFLSDTKIKIG